LNADPSPIEALTVPAIIEHLEGVVRALPSPPIIVGHSAGGAFTQILLDHGWGAAGVAMCSAPTGALDLPGAEEPRQPAQGGGLHP
jgi:pimeloyl-ACP methyl ester carboxylesterase